MEHQANLFDGDDDLLSSIRTQQDLVARPTAAAHKSHKHKGGKHKGGSHKGGKHKGGKHKGGKHKGGSHKSGSHKDVKPNTARPNSARPIAARLLNRRRGRLYDESTTFTTSSSSYSSTSYTSTYSTESRKKVNANINIHQHITGGGHVRNPVSGVKENPCLADTYFIIFSDS